MAATSAQGPDGPVTIFVGGGLESVTESVNTPVTSLAIGFPLLTLFVGASSWPLAGRALAPVESIRSEVTRINVNSIDSRVSVPGSGDSRVTVELSERSGTARLSVADDGPGIPADQTGTVFERFGRADSARGRDAGGVGLGLAIAREIVTAHRGRIYIVPEAEVGAKLIVEIPLFSS